MKKAPIKTNKFDLCVFCGTFTKTKLGFCKNMQHFINKKLKFRRNKKCQLLQENQSKKG